MTTRSVKVQCFRAQRGLGLIEIAISCFLMIIMAAFGLDLTLIMLAMSLNDSACRDAARAAAQQSTYSKAVQAAQAQLQVHATGGYWITQPLLASTAAPYFVYNDFAGNPPTNTSPYVTVTTTVKIRCPAPLFFFGVSFNQNGMIPYSRRYTFPIIKETFYP